MSGIEAIGLALALWPVVGTLNDLYNSIKDGSASRWYMTIKVQERIFKDSVSKLLQGDEDLSEKDRVGLVSGDKTFESLWKDEEFSSRLESRLDAEMCKLIKYEVAEISKLVNSLKKMLGERQLQAEPSTSKRMPKLSFREIKIAMKKDELRKNLKHLASHISDLRKLVKASSNTVYADAKKPNSAPADRRSTLLQEQQEQQKRTDAQFYNGFHEVLCKSFQCQCASGHEANLSVTDTLVMFQTADELKHAMPSMSSLRLRGRSTTMMSDQTVCGDVEDQAEEFEEERTSEWIRSTWSPTRHNSISARPYDNPALLIKYSESHGVQNFTPIPDLCQWIHAVQASPPNSPDMKELQGVLGDDAKRYTVRAPRKHASMKIMSMEEWLTSCGTESKRMRVRAELAMNLAATILQFYPTAWIEKTWTWQNFSVARDESSHNLVITQRFWSLGLPRASLKSAPPTPSRFWTMFQYLDPMLVRLGFALIELALGKRLSEIRVGSNADKDSKDVKDDSDDDGWDPKKQRDVDLADYCTAIGILESNEIEDEVGVAYQQVVDACLRCHVISDTGPKWLKSNSTKFGSELEQFVVEPLRRHHSSIWGTAQIPTY